MYISSINAITEGVNVICLPLQFTFFSLDSSFQFIVRIYSSHYSSTETQALLSEDLPSAGWTGERDVGVLKVYGTIAGTHSFLTRSNPTYFSLAVYVQFFKVVEVMLIRLT